MDLDQAATLAAAKFVTGDDVNICRLCFSEAEKQQFCITDTMKLDRPYYSDVVSFLDMFQELGVPSETQIPDVLCSDCAAMTINSFFFKKLYIYSNEKWHRTLDLLSQTLPKEDSFKENTKTVFVMIKEDVDKSFTINKNIKVKDKRTVLAKIKNSGNRKKKNITYETTIYDSSTDVMCEECGTQFSTAPQLKQHMKSHNKCNKPKCLQCCKTFASQLLLKQHIKRIHDPKVIHCSQCARMFSTDALLKQHIKQHHIAAICKICFVQLPSKTALRNHQDKHGINKCNQCNKEFQNAQSFKQHLKICGDTVKDPQFFCDICSKGYKRKNGLRSHLKVDHGFGKSFNCQWCSKKFDAISRLNNHIVKHTRERNFHCEHCGSQFVTKAALVYHVRLHTGERPFPCDMCNESFLSASRRMEHKRRKHMGPTRECPICHVKFVSGYILRTHVQRHYNPNSKLYIPEINPKNRNKAIKFES